VLDFDGSRKARRRELVWSAGVLVLALIILGLPDTYKRSIRQALRGTVLRPFLVTQSVLANRRASTLDVTQLRAQRDSLIAVVSAQATLAEENRRLRELQSLSARGGGSFVTAEVLRLGVGPAESTFMLNVGSANGVRLNSPVVAPEGLLGLVMEVSEHTSLAMDWTHPQFRASAMTADGQAYGMVQVYPGRSREEDLLRLGGAPFHTDITPGVGVVTTGRGQIIPRGIPLGIVIGIEEADTGWRKSYLLRPLVRPEAVTHVLVGIAAPGTDLSQFWHSTPSDSALHANRGQDRPLPADTATAMTTRQD
jgi:rod shape-determining protein MreC